MKFVLIHSIIRENSEVRILLQILEHCGHKGIFVYVARIEIANNKLAISLANEFTHLIIHSMKQKKATFFTPAMREVSRIQ